MESGSEIEDVIEVKEEITNEDFSENFSEKDRYYVNKTEKYCRNCNSIFGSENKFYQ
jgi:hypothetical protein